MKIVIFFLSVFCSSAFGQLAWTPLNTGTANDLINITFVNSNTGYALSKYSSSGANSQIFKTTNAGNSWSMVYN